jgi:hypothetical protein
LSADALARRLDKVSDLLASRPTLTVRGVSDFDTARRAAFIIGRANRPGASAQEVYQAAVMSSLIGLDPTLSA